MILRGRAAAFAAAFIFAASGIPGGFAGYEGRTAYAMVAAKGDYTDIAIARVTDYVNIRAEANTGSAILGKIYNNCAAVILETVQGEDGDWYHIKSGTVEGYIKAQYFLTGEEAEKVAAEVGTLYGTITGSDLNLRQEPNTQSAVLTRLQIGEEYVILGEENGFYKVQVDTDLLGYISKDYAATKMVFKEAVSLDEEKAEAEEAEKRKQEATDAVNKYNEAVIAANPEADNSASIITGAPIPVNNSNSSQASDESSGGARPDTVINPGDGSGSQSSGTVIISGPDGGPGVSGTNQGSSSGEESAVISARRKAIVAYAMQFAGNPYVYGGTSLTEGADCSGFVMSVFDYFGIDTGRDSRSQAAKCKKIDLSDIKPGDLLFYASGDYINHVAIYIGDGKVIHASNPNTGITVSDAYYRTPYMAGTFITE